MKCVGGKHRRIELNEHDIRAAIVDWLSEEWDLDETTPTFVFPGAGGDALKVVIPLSGEEKKTNA